MLMVLEMFLIAEIKISDFGGWRGSLSDACCCWREVFALLRVLGGRRKMM